MDKMRKPAITLLSFLLLATHSLMAITTRHDIPDVPDCPLLGILALSFGAIALVGCVSFLAAGAIALSLFANLLFLGSLALGISAIVLGLLGSKKGRRGRKLAIIGTALGIAAMLPILFIMMRYVPLLLFS
jgi:hypothetical protein